MKKYGRKSVFHANCSSCLVSVLLLFSENQKGAVSAGVVTDLDRQEVAGKFLGKTISSDEIIDAYQVFSRM